MSNTEATTFTHSTTDQVLPKCLINHLVDLQLTDVGMRTSRAAFTTTKLKFTMQKQTQSNWCWAAVATSIGNFYGTGSWKQCRVANAQLKRISCCCLPWLCNKLGYLDAALKTTRCFASMKADSISMSTINTQISLKRPIALRCAWRGGGAHFLVIYGTNGNYILVADSIYGNSTHALNSFPRSYRGGGTWTHTYFTRKN